MSMNVPVMRRTTVTPMPCAPTLKDHLSADVFEVMKAMAETVQVLIFFGVKLHSSLSLLYLLSSLRRCVCNPGFLRDGENCTGL